MAEDTAGELYALPLEEFTRARDERVKELRTAGKKEQADDVRALRKPSVPAWAVNQVARAEPSAIEELFAAGEKLRRAQRALARGGDPSVVKDATKAEREIVARLLSAAKKILRDAGNAANEATLERISDTFYATATEPDVREDVKAGRLMKEAKRVGFGDLPELSAVPAVAKKPRTEKANLARAQKEATKLATAAEDAEAEAEERERHAEDLAARAQRAREEADVAKEQARFARRAATEARREADRAARALERMK